MLHHGQDKSNDPGHDKRHEQTEKSYLELLIKKHNFSLLWFIFL